MKNTVWAITQVLLEACAFNPPSNKKGEALRELLKTCQDMIDTNAMLLTKKHIEDIALSKESERDRAKKAENISLGGVKSKIKIL